MAHKLDDLFRKKIKHIQDTLPDNSGFDEKLFWGELQKNLKPQRKSWWKWIALAACFCGLALWSVSIYKLKPTPQITSHIKKTQPDKKPRMLSEATVTEKIKKQAVKKKKKIITQPDKNLKIAIEPCLVTKTTSMLLQIPAIKHDSIHINPSRMADMKPQFKTIHVNEISNTDKTPVPQPKFKIRFAAKTQR